MCLPEQVGVAHASCALAASERCFTDDFYAWLCRSCCRTIVQRRVRAHKRRMGSDDVTSVYASARVHLAVQRPRKRSHTFYMDVSNKFVSCAGVGKLLSWCCGGNRARENLQSAKFTYILDRCTPTAAASATPPLKECGTKYVLFWRTGGGATTTPQSHQLARSVEVTNLAVYNGLDGTTINVRKCTRAAIKRPCLGETPPSRS